MGRRNNKPALYELSRKNHPADHQPSPVPQDESVQSMGIPWFTPGVGVRVPVGFLILALVLFVLIGLGGWWLGFAQGVAETEQLMADRPSQFTVDPLQQPSDLGDPTESDKLSPNQTGLLEDQAGSPAGSESENGASEAPEPLWHFVLAETGQDGALRLAEFCRQQGLEVIVVPRNNTGLARILALPGMTTSNRKASGVRALDERIAAIGRQWKKNGGRTDFSDRYMDRLQAP